MSWFFDTREQADKALQTANANWEVTNIRLDPPWSVPPRSPTIWQCVRTWNAEGIEVLGEGDSWCVIDESGEWMVEADGEVNAYWVYVS